MGLYFYGANPNTGGCLIVAKIMGFGGKVMIGATPEEVANVAEWELEYENEMGEAELMGKTAVEREYGLGSWEATITVVFDDTSVQQADLINAAINKTKVDVELYKNTTIKYSGRALVNFSDSMSANELNEMEFTLSGDGDLTVTGLPTGV
jgi:hypothetical protein